MKITKSQLRQIIKEEIGNIQAKVDGHLGIDKEPSSYQQAQKWINHTVNLAFTRGTPPPVQDISPKRLKNAIVRMYQDITKGKTDYFEELIFDYVEEMYDNEPLLNWYQRRIEGKLDIHDIIAMST